MAWLDDLPVEVGCADEGDKSVLEVGSQRCRRRSRSKGEIDPEVFGVAPCRRWRGRAADDFARSTDPRHETPRMQLTCLEKTWQPCHRTKPLPLGTDPLRQPLRTSSPGTTLLSMGIYDLSPWWSASASASSATRTFSAAVLMASSSPGVSGSMNKRRTIATW